jgi:protein SCO1/2
VNKKALWGLLIALMLPLVSYFIMKYYSDRAVVLPPKYLVDSVITETVDGKQKSDTIWHQLKDFTLTNQLGRQVSWKDVGRKIVVVDFFFTHCPTICVPMTKNMKRLQESIRNADKAGDRDPDFIQFLSFSIDPERDSVPRLKYWADRFQVNPENWWLLTGNKQSIYDMAIKEMKIGLEDGHGVDTNFFHTDHFVLVDRNRIVRGYYHGIDSASLAKLSQDIIFLSLEKDNKSKGIFSGQLMLIAVVMLVTVFAVGVFLLLFRKK